MHSKSKYDSSESKQLRKFLKTLKEEEKTRFKNFAVLDNFFRN